MFYDHKKYYQDQYIHFLPDIYLLKVRKENDHELYMYIKSLSSIYFA